MKKILTIALIIGFVCAGNAFAEWDMDGTLRVINMTIYEAEPTAFNEPAMEAIYNCDVSFEFTTFQANPQFYVLDGEAFGNALNLALWTAHLIDQPVTANVQYSFPPNFYIHIYSVTY